MSYKMVRRIAVMGMGLVTMTGCAVSTDQLRAVSAGYTGCTPDQITISNRAHVGTLGTAETWSATCQGKVYVCSGFDRAGEYSCAPAPN